MKVLGTYGCYMKTCIGVNRFYAIMYMCVSIESRSFKKRKVWILEAYVRMKRQDELLKPLVSRQCGSCLNSEA